MTPRPRCCSATPSRLWARSRRRCRRCRHNGRQGGTPRRFATETSAAEGQIIIKQGDYPVELIGIEEGTAAVMRGGEKIASLGPGDLIGEMGLLERRPRNADVIASSPMRLIKLTHWEVRRMSVDTVNRIKQMIEDRRRSGVPDPGHHSSD